MAEKEPAKQIRVIFQIDHVTKEIEIPLIPKVSDVIEIGSKRCIVTNVKYKEQNGSFVPVITLEREKHK